MIEKFPNQKKRQKDFKCSLGFAMTVIGSKWRAIILWHILKTHPIRYGQLKKSIPKNLCLLSGMQLLWIPLKPVPIISKVLYPVILEKFK